MATVFQIPNFSLRNIKEVTGLGVDVPLGTTAITLQNNNNIVANDFLLIGRIGGEYTELRTASSVSGVTIVTTDQTKFDHIISTPVTVLFGDKLRIYRASNTNGLPPDDINYSVLNTITIDPDQVQTMFSDPSGTSDYWYKLTYLNSLTNAETALSEGAAVRGGGYGQYVSLESIRNAAGFQGNRNITDALIDEKRRAAQDYINGKLYGRYTVPFATPVNAVIENLTRVIAADLLLSDQYGPYYVADKTLADQIKMAYAQLKEIVDGSLVLLDQGGSPLPGSGGGGGTGSNLGFSGWPNSQTPDGSNHETGSGDFMFRASDVVGYNGRAY